MFIACDHGSLRSWWTWNKGPVLPDSHALNHYPTLPISSLSRLSREMQRQQRKAEEEALSPSLLQKAEVAEQKQTLHPKEQTPCLHILISSLPGPYLPQLQPWSEQEIRPSLALVSLVGTAWGPRQLPLSC